MVIIIFLFLLVNSILAGARNENLNSRNDLHRIKLIEREDLSSMDEDELFDVFKNTSLNCITEQLENFTIDYNILEIDEDCMENLNETTRLIALFNAMENYGKYLDALREDILDGYKFLSQYNNPVDCDLGYDEYSTSLHNYKTYLAELEDEFANLDEEMLETIKCPSDGACGCLSQETVDGYEEKAEEMSTEVAIIERYLTFGVHVDPMIRFIIIILGLTLNVVFLAIFLQHKYIRNNDNTMIYSTLMNNILLVLLYLPLQYVHYYFPNSISSYDGSSGYSFFEAVETMLITVDALSLIMLSLQRYRHITKEVSNSFSSPRAVTRSFRSYLYSVSPIWVTAFFVSYFVFFFNCDMKNSSCVVKCLLYCIVFIVYIGIIPTAAITYNKYSRDQLMKLTEDRRMYLEHQHITSTTVITAVVGAYWITHIPIFIWLLDYIFHFITLNIDNINCYTSIEMLTCYFLSSYACIIPIIFLTRLHYLYQCWYKLDEEPYKSFL